MNGEEESSNLCSLCSLHGELRKSHFIPKSLYKLLRKGMAPEFSSPISVNLVDGKSYLSDAQPTARLLCGKCEQKFSTKGESKVIPQLRNQDGFTLRDAILENDKFVCARNLNDVNGLNYYAYAYFSISIMWRGSVYDWPQPYHLMARKLGPYQEQFRRWLENEDSFPQKTYIEIIVDTEEESPAFGAPNISMVNDLGTMRVYQFIAFGVWFRVHVGGILNDKGKDAFRGGPLPIAFRKSSFSDLGISELALYDLNRTIPVKKLRSVLEKRRLEAADGEGAIEK